MEAHTDFIADASTVTVWTPDRYCAHVRLWRGERLPKCYVQIDVPTKR